MFQFFNDNFIREESLTESDKDSNGQGYSERRVVISKESYNEMRRLGLQPSLTEFKPLELDPIRLPFDQDLGEGYHR